MNYNLVINGTKTTTIYVPANEETIANIIIDSLNTVDSKYELIYKVCTNEDCDSLIDTPENLLVEYSSRTTDAVTGEIPASESKIVRLGITNNTDNGYYLLFDINAGYIHSTLALQNQIINEYNEDVTIAAIIDGDISTTFPTTSDFIATVECKTNKEESNAEGTATWNGTKWTLDITGADSGKTVCNVYFKGPYNEKKGVNRPVLFTGMTPVKWVWDDEKEIYEEASPVNYDEDWYDYNAKKWANAKTADGSYWVWIPRYAYKITDGYHSSTTGTIDIEFLRGTTNDNDSSTNIKPTEEYNADTKNTSDNHFLHPAFDVEGSKLGFWIAKYEPTYVGVATITGTCDSEDNIITNKTVQILPGATSWRCINVSNAYNATLNMKSNPAYGWDEDEVDPHMLTNIEWGAVTYLSKSTYGADKEEIWNNAFNQYRTGCSGTGVNANSEPTCVVYNTTHGVKASTTHNIYGVYDMSGGAWDRVMGNYNNLPASSGFNTTEITNIPAKYISRYTTEELYKGYGMEYDTTIYGDAVYETSYGAARHNGTAWEGNGAGSWYGDYSYLPHTSYPWFYRGGYWDDGTSAGLFGFYNTNGGARVRNSFRPAVGGE